MHTKGFTLIEVLIALAILAISLTALLKTTHEVLNGSNQIKEKSIKHWIAMQAITKVQLGNIRPQLGRETTYATKVFHKQWHVRIKTKTTSIRHLQKIIVDISSNQYGPFTEQLMAFYYE